MTRDELLYELRALELKLLSLEMRAYINKQDATTKSRYFGLCLDLRLVITKLTTIELAKIADRLDDLSDELESGIADLEKALEKLQEAIDVINTLSTVVGYAARIVGLV